MNNKLLSLRGIAVLLLVYVTFISTQSPALAGGTAELISGAVQEVPIAGTVTMVDLGAHSCVPCKMMKPILQELSEEYEGRAAIVFIDVWKAPGVAKQFALRAIPTQIFYDAEGQEQYRHEGFMDKESIMAMLQKLGVK